GGGGHGRLAEGWRVGSRRPASTGRRGGRDGRGGREGPGRAGGGSALAPPERNGLPAPRRPRGDSLEGDGRWTVGTPSRPSAWAGSWSFWTNGERWPARRKPGAGKKFAASTGWPLSSGPGRRRRDSTCPSQS